MSYPNPEHPTYTSDSSEEKAVFIKFFSSWSNAFLRITQVSNNMSLSQKIKSVYIFIIGIAVLGSTISFAIGDYYYVRAKQQKIKITQEHRLLDKLRHTAFEIQSVTGLSSSSQKTENIHKAKVVAIESHTKVKLFLEKFNNSPNNFSVPKVKKILTQYRDTSKNLSQNLDTILNQIEPLKSKPNTIPQVQRKLADFSASETNKKLLYLADELGLIIKIAENKEEEAAVELKKAELSRIIIIFIGISLTLITTYLLTVYATKIIIIPLDNIKKIVREIAEKPDLIAELPTKSNDGLGDITNYLNQIVINMKNLVITNQEAEKACDVANQAKRRFMANISHELLTPLNGILGYTQVLHNSSNITQKEERGIKVIHKCAEHLLTLINDTIEFSKIDLNTIKLNLSDFNLRGFLEEIIDIYKIQAQQKDISFIYEIPVNLPSLIAADKQKLRRVIINLLGNALKFTEQGNITFKVITSYLTDSEIKIKFVVRDTGVGINKADLEKIFLPFEKVVDSKNYKDGTGLGLSISQKMIELMGSCIEVDSELGKGSSFTFEIKFPVVENSQEKNISTKNRKIIGYYGEAKKILIIEDLWEDRSSIVNILEPLGFDLVEAANGKEGLEKAREYQPDLIISDIYMPILDTWEMLSYMDSYQNLKDIPFILTSTSISDKDKITFLNAKYFLIKPIQNEELYRLIEKELDINWKYAESDNFLEINLNRKQQESIIFPPSSELIMLLDYAKKGQIKGIIEELEKIADINSEYQDFVNHLNVLLKDFNIKNIRSFLKENIQE